MACESDLSRTEKDAIIAQLGKGSVVLEIAKILNRDNRVVK